MTARARKTIIVAALLAVGAVLGWLLLPKRDLEVALGVSSLPKSIADLHVARRGGMTDYGVAAYFRIAPEDLRRILDERPYELQDEWIPQNPVSKTFPDISAWDDGHYFVFKQNDPITTFCYLWANAEMNRVYVIYGAD